MTFVYTLDNQEMMRVATKRHNSRSLFTASQSLLHVAYKYVVNDIEPCSTATKHSQQLQDMFMRPWTIPVEQNKSCVANVVCPSTCWAQRMRLLCCISVVRCCFILLTRIAYAIEYAYTTMHTCYSAYVQRAPLILTCLVATR